MFLAYFSPSKPRNLHRKALLSRRVPRATSLNREAQTGRQRSQIARQAPSHTCMRSSRTRKSWMQKKDKETRAYMQMLDDAYVS